MGDFPIVSAEGVEFIGLLHHPIDVHVHQHLREFLVVQSPRLISVVFYKQSFDLLGPEIASEFIHSLCEGFQITRTLVGQVEVGQGLLGAFPFVGLAITLLSNFLKDHQFDLSKPLRRHVICCIAKLPDPLQQIDKILH